jgi:Enoyl-CoA hydratase/isomerase
MTVGYEVREEIAYISFNRPEKHNALRDEDIAALVDALDRLDTDDRAQIGIVFGEGRSFSSGGDVNDRLQRSMDEGTTRDRTTESDAFVRCVNWKPVIAAVHGYCLGHALGTALYCDHLVAARDATFEVTEIKLGHRHPPRRRGPAHPGGDGVGAPDPGEPSMGRPPERPGPSHGAGGGSRALPRAHGPLRLGNRQRGS